MSGKTEQEREKRWSMNFVYWDIENVCFVELLLWRANFALWWNGNVKMEYQEWNMEDSQCCYSVVMCFSPCVA